MTELTRAELNEMERSLDSVVSPGSMVVSEVAFLSKGRTIRWKRYADDPLMWAVTVDE